MSANFFFETTLTNLSLQDVLGSVAGEFASGVENRAEDLTADKFAGAAWISG